MRLAQLVERPLDSRKVRSSNLLSHTMEIWIKILFTVLTLPGIFIMVFPTAPGIPYLFLLSLTYGILDGFDEFRVWYLAILGGFVILAGIVDYFAGLLGARYGGASRQSLIYGFVGLLLGTLLFPPLGAFLGLFLGIFIAELITFKDQIRALRSAGFSLLGAVSGVLINFCIALGFVTTFLVFIW